MQHFFQYWGAEKHEIMLNMSHFSEKLTATSITFMKTCQSELSFSLYLLSTFRKLIGSPIAMRAKPLLLQHNGYQIHVQGNRRK